MPMKTHFTLFSLDGIARTIRLSEVAELSENINGVFTISMCGRPDDSFRIPAETGESIRGLLAQLEDTRHD